MTGIKQMQRLFRVWRGLTIAAVSAAALGLAACSAPQATTGSGMQGYGTPGVSAYMANDQAGGLQAELDQCRKVPQTGAATEIRGLEAACRQLHRTLRNQPGNTVQ
jgi:hypothetical protein